MAVACTGSIPQNGKRDNQEGAVFAAGTKEPGMAGRREVKIDENIRGGRKSYGSRQNDI